MLSSYFVVISFFHRFDRALFVHTFVVPITLLVIWFRIRRVMPFIRNPRRVRVAVVVLVVRSFVFFQSSRPRWDFVRCSGVALSSS